jgi:hypothetical protein
MKNVAITLLRTGHTTSQKDITRAFYWLKPLIKTTEFGTVCNSNKFWSPENNDNRSDLIRDMHSYHKDIRKGSQFHILNRYENGDGYGIAK